MKNKQIEEIMEEFWKMFDDNAFVKSTDSITDKVENFPLAITDMEAIVKINGKFDKEAIELWIKEKLTLSYNSAINEMVNQFFLERGCSRNKN